MGVLDGVLVGVAVGPSVGVPVDVFVAVGVLVSVPVGVEVGVDVFVGVVVRVLHVELRSVKSSMAKSFPPLSVLRSMISIVADVLAAEFQVTANCCHKPAVRGAVIVPTGLPLIRNCSCAGAAGNQLVTQAENS